jgi:ribosomal protein L40E
MSQRSKIEKAEAAKPVTELVDMDIEMVSLVKAGANRQRRFLMMKALACPKCKAENEDGATECKACGEKLEQPPKEKADPPAPPPAIDGVTPTEPAPSPATEKDGTQPPASDAPDLGARLAEVTKRLEGISKMTKVDPAPVAVPEPVAKADRAEIEKANADMAALRTSVEKLSTDLASANAEHEKTRGELAQATRLRAGVGAPVSKSTGEQVSKALAQQPASGEKPWPKDLAAVVAQRRREAQQKKGS